MSLNLLPLGRIVSVAYSIICPSGLSVTDQITKTAQEFFKSPIQTTLRISVQWYWVPIVLYKPLKILCRALKQVCLVVAACWVRCFPPKTKDPREFLFPDIVVTNILSCLTLRELGVMGTLNKEWNTFINPPAVSAEASVDFLTSKIKEISTYETDGLEHFSNEKDKVPAGIAVSVLNLWKERIYEQIAFSSKNWAQWNEDIVEGVDLTKEYLSLPKNIVEVLRRSYQAFPKKTIRESYVLVRMPKELNLNKLRELEKKYRSVHDQRAMNTWQVILGELVDKSSVDESAWLLMTKELKGTRDKSYSEQKKIVAKLAETTQVPYEVPTALQAATCILADYSGSKKSLFRFSYTQWITRCQESVQDSQIVVRFSPGGGGLCFDKDDNKDVVNDLYYNWDADKEYKDVGIAALCKF